jgi:sugar phosphate isomerase/epimerase
VDELDSEYIAACLDVGHVGLIYGQEAPDSIRALGADRLIALHICDNDYCGDQHQLCGQGKLNWVEILRALREIGYRGDFTYEADGGFLGRFPDYLKPEAARFMYRVGQTLLQMNPDGKDCQHET